MNPETPLRALINLLIEWREEAKCTCESEEAQYRASEDDWSAYR